MTYCETILINKEKIPSNLDSSRLHDNGMVARKSLIRGLQSESFSGTAFQFTAFQFHAAPDLSGVLAAKASGFGRILSDAAMGALMETKKMKVLMVCLGNICRSPMAQAVLESMLGSNSAVTVDSAGCGDYHLGDPPDARARACTAARGYNLERQRARLIQPADFSDFDLILAMDRANLQWLQKHCPKGATAQIKLLMDYPRAPVDEVADPYFGAADGFEAALDTIEAGCTKLLERELLQRRT